mmetsp:Transcript_32144/g.78297  ORF Transcript_32144/g.78297 Transcript_32144/m.78297 type:complete len:132 (+) Transcript_32144:1946-2341(+)
MNDFGIKLPDFATLSSAVKSSRVDESFENTIAEIAGKNSLAQLAQKISDNNVKPIAVRTRRVLQRTGLVPRQVSGGTKRTNVSTEDVEAWTTSQRMKARRISEAKRTKRAVENKMVHPGYSRGSTEPPSSS